MAEYGAKRDRNRCRAHMIAGLNCCSGTMASVELAIDCSMAKTEPPPARQARGRRLASDQGYFTTHAFTLMYGPFGA